MSTSGRGPDALLPVWAARLVGFAALGSLGALQWQRMIEGQSSGRALLWVAAATVAAALVLACERLSPRLYSFALPAATLGGLLLAVASSGLDLEYLKPARWDDLVEGVTAGVQSLGTVRMPYGGSDPWPRVALELGGALLLALSAQLACWPRTEIARGYPFLALVGLLVLVVSPVVSLGGTRPLLLGAAIAALTVCFLWLERLPLRPGIGVAALLGVALAGALPLAAVADRGEPWFDYKAFAEGLGPDDPVRFNWDQGYGPIDWPRDGNEVMRVTSDEPHYWKAANLSRFDGTGWARTPPDGGDVDSELRQDWRNEPGWRDTVEVSVRRMRTTDVPAPGAIMEVDDATRPLQPSGVPGRWEAVSELRRGDSYTVTAYVPTPTSAQMRQADFTGLRNSRNADLELAVPFLPDRMPTARSVGGVGGGRLDSAVVHFRPFGDDAQPYVNYPDVRRASYDAVDRTFRRTPYARTWRLAQRLRSAAETPFEYILLVNGYLPAGLPLLRAAPAGRARPRPARRVHQRHQGGLLPALRGCDGATAADGRDPGAGGDGLQPGRLLQAPRRLDRARHRRPRVGGGVVRRARLGHLRPHPGRHAGPVADRGAAGARDADPDLRERRRRGGRRRRDRPAPRRAPARPAARPAAQQPRRGGRRGGRRPAVVALGGARRADRGGRAGARPLAGRAPPARRPHAARPHRRGARGRAPARRPAAASPARPCASSSSASARPPRPPGTCAP